MWFLPEEEKFLDLDLELGLDFYACIRVFTVENSLYIKMNNELLGLDKNLNLTKRTTLFCDTEIANSYLGGNYVT